MSNKSKDTTFAGENHKNINRKGRPKGSKNKLPSDPQLEELIKKNMPEAMSTIIDIMRKSNKDEVRLKAATLVLDKGSSIIQYDKRMGLNGQGKPTGKEENTSQEVDEEDQEQEQALILKFNRNKEETG